MKLVKCHLAAYWDSWYFHFYLNKNKGLKFSVLVHNVLGSRSGIMFPDPVHNPVAKFMVAVWGDKVNCGTARQPYVRVDFIPTVMDYEFGYWIRSDLKTAVYKLAIRRFYLFLTKHTSLGNVYFKPFPNFKANQVSGVYRGSWIRNWKKNIPNSQRCGSGIFVN